jgi:sugar O-acyltransferase (sialic acid O-acetyltransferase NeuD family)
MKPLVIFGLGVVADVAYHHFKRDGDYDIKAFTVDSAWMDSSSGGQQLYQGLPVVPFDFVQDRFDPAVVNMFVAIGYHGLNTIRAQKCREAKAKGYTLTSYISPRVDAGPWMKTGENCLILDGVGVQPGAEIGNNVSIWNNSLIGHHAKVEDDCWLAAGTTLGGLMTLGAGSFVGLNATLGGDIKIGSSSFIGAGAVVLKDCEPKSVFIQPNTDKFRLNSGEFLRMTTLRSIGTRK